MPKAWKEPDGTYILFEGTISGWLEGRELMRKAGIPTMTEWRATAEEVDRIEPPLAVEKVFGVLAGPSSCGCEPSGFRWVTEFEVKAGQTNQTPCEGCTHGARLEDRCVEHVYCHCPIIDVMGEADTARQVYEAEFEGKYEGVI